MKIDFFKYRYICFAFSLIVIIGGIAYGMITGFKFDIDFKGGTTIEADLKEDFKNSDLENIVKEQVGKTALIQKKTGGTSSVTITTDAMSLDESDKVVAALKTKYTKMDEPSVRNIQPSYGKELLNSALLSVGVAVILILLYVGIRFKTLGFTAAITAVIALLHDALFLIAVYGIFKLPINSTFVAVILTLIGYSINDTIIIYDRIRENKRKVTKASDDRETINLSLNQTLKRTINTSLTTIVAIAVVYVFAVIYNQTVLKEFSLPLVIGVLVGTYSSVFIASSLWYSLDSLVAKFKKSDKKVNKKQKAK